MVGIGGDKLLDMFVQKLDKKFVMGENYISINPGDIVLDIGACTGDMTLYYSWKVGPEGRVYAIEPDRKINLKRIMYLAKDSKNIYPCNCAITNNTGEAPLYLSVDTSHHSMREDFIWSDEPKERFKLNVKTFTLDDFIEYAKIPKVDVIYMNVEGSELDILSGGLKTLSTFAPKLYIAPHELEGINLKTQLITKLEELGYKTIDYHNLIYASKNIDEFGRKETLKCFKCGNYITYHEENKLDGACLGCYTEFIHEWFKKIFLG
jgi:FkbM family methyltransferase